MANPNVSHLASYIRSRFRLHSQTVQNLVAHMSDEALVAKWHAHHALQAERCVKMEVVQELIVSGQLKDAAWHRPHYLKAVR